MTALRVALIPAEARHGECVEARKRTNKVPTQLAAAAAAEPEAFSREKNGSAEAFLDAFSIGPVVPFGRPFHAPIRVAIERTRRTLPRIRHPPQPRGPTRRTPTPALRYQSRRQRRDVDDPLRLDGGVNEPSAVGAHAPSRAPRPSLPRRRHRPGRTTSRADASNDAEEATGRAAGGRRSPRRCRVVLAGGGGGREAPPGAAPPPRRRPRTPPRACEGP